ncbi:hypothetical protein C819_02031 [Lachnospiraceae bacterium 10-1]|nr:hypothetical protein C819_02031 [Lachnospiraceae bacterium 10-1]
MKILFTICGRAGSKGIKNKNIKEFLGYPLPYYTLSALDLYLKKISNSESDIVLNTDSKELIELFEKNPIRPTWIIEREENLGQDNTPKIAVIKNCLEEMKKRTQKDYDMVVDLDITSPLRRIFDIENIIEEKEKFSYDVVFSVTDSRRNPYFNMVKKSGELFERVIKSNFNSRQEAPEIYDMNASIYAYSPQFLLTGKNIFDGKCGIIKMYDTGILDLDHENDFELMQVIANFLFNNDETFGEIRKNLLI